MDAEAIIENTDIPESNILSILLYTPYNELFLYESSPEEIKKFFREIQKLEFQMQEEYMERQKEDMVFMAESIPVNSQGNYIRIHIRSYDDDYHYFDIYQENQEIIYVSTKSE